MFASAGDEEFRALLVLTAVLLLAGTIFYHRQEGWNLLDSAFFSVLGISVLLGFINKVAGEMVQHRTRRSGRRGEGGNVSQTDSTVEDSVRPVHDRTMR